MPYLTLFGALIPVRYDQIKRERDQDSHLDPSHRSLHDVTYNPITNKHMKSYKNRSRSKNHGWDNTTYIVRVARAIMACVGCWSSHMYIIRNCCRIWVFQCTRELTTCECTSSFGDMNWSPSHFTLYHPQQHYVPVTYAYTSMHTGKVGSYMHRKGLIKTI